MKHVGSLVAIFALTIISSGHARILGHDGKPTFTINKDKGRVSSYSPRGIGCDTVLSQNPYCDINDGGGVACGVAAEGTTAENWYARNFFIEGDTTIGCINWGGSIYGDLDVTIYFSEASGPGNPAGVTLTPIGSVVQSVNIDNAWYATQLDVPISLSAGSYLVVEINTPDSGTDGGMWLAATTTATETCYIKSETCGIASYLTVEDIGFPNSQYLMCLGGFTDPCTIPLSETCTADVDGDLVVSVSDVLAIIASWGVTGDGTYRPQGDCAPNNPAKGIHGDCTVDVSDILAVIGAWGEDCRPRGACCSDTGECSDDVLQVDCEAMGSFFLGENSQCSLSECASGACCLEDLTCVEDTVMWICDQNGGIFHGDGSLCSDADVNNCEPLPGACCFKVSCIADSLEVDCDSFGGVFMGDGTDCDSCPAEYVAGGCDVDENADLGCVCFVDGDDSQNDCNGGGNMSVPAFSNLNLGESICGTSSVYFDDPGANTYRDLDWYVNDAINAGGTFDFTIGSNYACVILMVNLDTGLVDFAFDHVAGFMGTTTGTIPAGNWAIVATVSDWNVDVICGSGLETYTLEVN